MNIPKRYLVDENDKKVAVEIDIKTFTKIEEVLENYGLYKLMRETARDKSLNLKDAKKYYSGIKVNAGCYNE